MSNKCTHTRTRIEESTFEDWEGETRTTYRRVEESTCEDIDIGRFRCTMCGEIGYYTGQWKDYFEKGIPCLGSDKVKRD